MKNDMPAWVSGLVLAWFVYLVAEAVWHSKARYALQYANSYGEVIKEKKPHDCDWLTAPLGDKNCHYDAQVQVQTIATGTDSNSGRPIVSYDNGKTWDFNDGANPAKASITVYVGWQKVDE